MAEYIERDIAAAFAYNCGAVYVANRLSDSNAFPAADVAPVRHGRWIEQKYSFGVMYDCSICGHLILDAGHSWNYCPNCGARMDGGSD